MPNWCKNTLRVRSKNAEAMSRFLEVSSTVDNKFMLNKAYPKPKKTDSIEGVSLTKWCEINWGTKWDVEGEIKITSNTEVEIAFESAWNPPVEWLEHIATQFLDCKFFLQYREEGCGFEGEIYAFGDEFENYCHDIFMLSFDYEKNDWDE